MTLISRPGLVVVVGINPPSHRHRLSCRPLPWSPRLWLFNVAVFRLALSIVFTWKGTTA